MCTCIHTSCSSTGRGSGGGWTNPLFQIIVLNWNIFQKSSQISPNPRLIVCARTQLRMGLYIHTHIHACTRERACSYTRTHIHAHAYALTQARAIVCVRGCVRACVRSCGRNVTRLFCERRHDNYLFCITATNS